jgi:predicted DCC family thiol-disulfide oxidoreductase YuxK
MEKEKKTVVYDDGCPTCTVGVEFAKKLDGKEALEFVGMNTEKGKQLVQENGLDMNASAYVLHSDGSRTEKARMMVEVLSHNGLIGFVLSLPFRVPVVGELLYYLLTLHRRHLTKSD